MNIEQLEVFLQVAGRYQVYSDGVGNYLAMPVHPGVVEVTPQSLEQLDTQSDNLIYNNQQD